MVTNLLEIYRWYTGQHKANASEIETENASMKASTLLLGLYLLV